MKKYRLADIAEIVISSVDKKTKPGEKIVRLCNFTDVYHNWAIKQSDYDSFMVASASDSNINKLSLKKGFVAFTKDSETRDDIGISTYIADNFDDVVLGYHCALAKPNEKIVYGKYLNAFMSSDYIKKYFELNATGSGMRFTLAVSTMEDMPIMLPSLNIQKKIGDMLSDFDKRIENLRAQNRVLEQTAKTIYDYTFLQCAGHQTTYNKTLNRNIPANWEVKTIGEFFKLYDSKRVPLSKKQREKMKGQYPYYGATGVMDFVNNYLFDGDFILLAEDGSTSDENGHPVVQLISGKNWVNNHAHIMLPNNPADIYFGYYTLKCIPAKKIESGTIQKKISQENLLPFQIAVPDTITMRNFNNQVTPLFRKLQVNTKQIETLTTQRNTLLSLLMTGQIEVM